MGADLGFGQQGAGFAGDRRKDTFVQYSIVWIWRPSSIGKSATLLVWGAWRELPWCVQDSTLRVAGLTIRMGSQNSLAISSPWMLPKAPQVPYVLEPLPASAVSRSPVSTFSETKRTEPSASSVLTPPGWKLEGGMTPQSKRGCPSMTAPSGPRGRRRVGGQHGRHATEGEASIGPHHPRHIEVRPAGIEIRTVEDQMGLQGCHHRVLRTSVATPQLIDTCICWPGGAMALSEIASVLAGTVGDHGDTDP